MFLLFFIVAPFGWNVVKFYVTDKQEILSELKEYLKKRSFEDKLIPPDFLEDKERKLAYVFGGSSVVLNYPTEKKNEVFSYFLDEAISDFQIINLGKEGSDSFYIRDYFKVEDAPKPNVVFIYSGHNDYTNAYRKIVRPPFYLLKGTVISWWVKYFARYKENPNWFLNYNLEPKTFQFFEKLGLVKLDISFFQKVDTLIENSYRENLSYIVEKAKREGIKVVLLSPISNLHLLPWETANQRKYFKALKSNFAERTMKLKEIRDSDYLAPDTRAKRKIHEILKGLASPKEGIFFISLEEELERRERELDKKAFYDYFHFYRDFHKEVAEIILVEVRKFLW